MRKTFDLTKFRKKATSKIEGISVGFHDPKTWITTGNYCLNYLISGRFDRGIPLSQISMLAGESGSGKSLIAANVIREALEMGITIVAIDTENALTKEWLKNAGIDVDYYEKQNQFMRIQVALVDKVAETIHEFMEGYIDEVKELDPDERTKVLIVVDSLGMLLTRADQKQFRAGDLKGDFGHKPKALNQLVRNCVVQFADWDVGLLATNHTYASQDMFNPDDTISGGGGFIFASSIVIAMKKGKLKLDEFGNKTTDVLGIRAMIKVAKSRYAKPFEGVHVQIPWETGIDKYSGLVDLFEKQGLFVKDGNKLKYTDSDGVEKKQFRKHFMTEDGKKALDTMMYEFDTSRNARNLPEVEELEDDAEEI